MPALTAAPTAAQKAQALDHVRRLTERRSEPLAADAPHAVRSVGIVGAGMMGRAIAAAHLKHGIPVALTDMDPAAITAAPARVAAELAEDLPAADAAAASENLLRVTGELGELARCEFVLESIVEDLLRKQSLCAELESRLPDSALMASNTSTIRISRIAAALKRPERFCGFHLFHPVRERPLVEVIRGERTSRQTIAAAAAHARAIGRTPILVGDGPGFLVNRLLFPCLAEALKLLAERAPIEAVDRAAHRFGLAKGPLELIDEIGLDVTLHGAIALSAAFDDRLPRSSLLVAMVKAGRLGCKVGKGFYTYREAPGRIERRKPDGDVRRLVQRSAGEPREHTSESIAERLVLPMVLEATRALEDRVVDDPGDVDLAVLLGLGFPRERGGLLWWADAVGAEELLATLRRHAHLGPRGQPTPALMEMARTGRRFYAADAAEGERQDEIDRARNARFHRSSKRQP